MIEGVRLVDLARHEDDRGFLYEIIHATDNFLHKFGQTYVVCSPARSTVRGFHKHNVLWDYFCVVRGSGKFVLAKEPDTSVLEAAQKGGEIMPEGLEVYVLTERKPTLLIVPAGVWHGWMALEDDTMVLATGSEVYNRANPDELRVPPSVFGDVWGVKGR